ncbi:MAG TPA: FG-GAP-like repeat-containing protein, partial [Candidatus Eisenbacteria bacterium]
FVVTWTVGSPARTRLPLDGAIMGLASTRNGDVRLDVVTLANGHVAVLADGEFAPGWPRPTGGLLFGDPVLLELGGGAEPEIAVAGSDSLMYVWSLDGTSRPGFPARLPDAVLTSSSAGDLDGDGIPELVVVTADDRVSIVRMGGSVRNWSDANPAPLAGASHAPPILADVTGDGRLDVVLTGNDRVMVLGNPAGPSVTWMSTWPMSDPLVGEVIAADLTGVGSFAVVTTHASGKVVVRPYGGLNGSPIAEIETDSEPAASALAIPIDGNGETGLAVVTVDGCVRAFRATGEAVSGWPKRLAADAGGRWAAGSDPGRDAPVLNVEAVDGTLQRFALAAAGPVVSFAWGMVGANPARTRSVAPTTPAAPVDPERPDVVRLPPGLLALPNPARAGAPVTFAPAGGRTVMSLVIHDVLGRVVRRIDAATNDNRSGVLSWDGRSDVGRPPAAGFYVARARLDDGTVATARFVVLR